MIRVSKETDRVLMVGYQRRFATEARYLKDAIDSGRFGEIYFVRAHWTRRRGIPGLGGWFTNKRLSGGGALIDIGVHVLDLGLWFLGYPTPLRVSASYGSRFGARGKGGGRSSHRVNNPDGLFDVDDYTMAHLSFGGGRSMMLQASWASHSARDEVGIEIWGTEAGARLYPLEIFSEDGEALVDSRPQLPDVYPFELSTAHFVDVIKGRDQLICPPEEALKTIEVIESIYAADDSH
jgi:predicted dehydrogenase